MRKLFGVVFGFSLAAQCFAGDPLYPVSDIPASLKENMYAVIRDESIEYRINSSNSYTEHVHEVVTVLSERGVSYGAPKVDYNKLRKLSYLKANVYDSYGTLIKKVKGNEMHDYSLYDGFSLYGDNRIRLIPITANKYPYTVEVDYEIEGKFLYSFDFFLFDDDEVSIQKEVWTVIQPGNYDLKIKSFNLDQAPIQKTLSDGSKSQSWTFENVTPNKFEFSSPYIREYVPTVMIEPTVINYQNYSGNLDSWKGMGLWQSQLNQNRDQLPDATRAKVHQMTDALPSQEEKVKALYQYLQGKTRYVSIQLGIGGQQPFEASVVDETGYGDCKALSNYMVALLKEAGIKGYYTLVGAGDHAPTVIRDFPYDYFNHVIVSVPIERDTIWLECTNQQKPFDYLGTFTSDRLALMVTEDGGKLVRTQALEETDNLKQRHAYVKLELNGNATANVKTNYNGLQYDDGDLAFAIDMSYDDQKKWVTAHTQIPSFDIKKFSINARKEKIPSATVALDLTLNRFGSTSGKRLFFTPNLMNRSAFVPPTNITRHTDFVQAMGYINTDTIEYSLPEGLYPEYIPESVTLDSPFGHYEATFRSEEGRVLYFRKFIIHKGRFPPSSYGAIADFYKSVNKADNLRAIFLDKT